MTKGGAKLTDPVIHPTQEFLKNPYPVLATMREQAPVFWSEQGKYWLVTRYDDCAEILRDLQWEKGFDRFKTLNPIAKLFPDMADKFKFRAPKSMLNSNPPDHTRLRGLVNKAFTPARINEMRAHIEEITNKLLDNVESKGEMDLIADYAFILPVTVIAEMLGIPPEDREKFKRWSHTLTEALEPSTALPKVVKAAEANRELTQYLKPLVDERRKQPKSDLISALVQAEEEGNKLTEDELMANIVLLLVAGHETTVNLIGNGSLALMKNPEQFELLKQKPELIETAVEEFLRYDSPVQLIRRKAAVEMQLGGQTIKPEDNVLLLTGAANHDPAHFESPDKLDITRTNNKHLAFGMGIHHCLGSSLAKAEGKIAIGALIKRLPNMRLKKTDLEYRVPFALRGVKEMPVVF